MGRRFDGSRLGLDGSGQRIGRYRLHHHAAEGLRVPGGRPLLATCGIRIRGAAAAGDMADDGRRFVGVTGAIAGAVTGAITGVAVAVRCAGAAKVWAGPPALQARRWPLAARGGRGCRCLRHLVQRRRHHGDRLLRRDGGLGLLRCCARSLGSAAPPAACARAASRRGRGQRRWPACATGIVAQHTGLRPASSASACL